MKRKIKNALPYIVLLFLLYIMIRYWDILIAWIFRFIEVSMPLFVGILIAYILNITMECYEEKCLAHIIKNQKTRRVLSILFTLFSFVFVIVLILMIVIPQMKSALSTLIANIPELYNFIVEFVENNEFISGYVKELPITEVSVSNALNTILDFLGNGAGNSVLDAVKSTLSITTGAFMSFVFALYLLAGKEKIGNRIKQIKNRFLPARFLRRSEYILGVINKSYKKFIIGQCIEAFVIGGLCALGMFIFSFPYAMMTGVVVGVTALIPIFGAYIGGIVGFLMVFTDSPIKAVFFVIYLVILQQLENQLIYPKVVGESIGLPGMWVFATVIIGSGLFGVLGMLILIPLVAAAYKLLNEYLDNEVV